MDWSWTVAEVRGLRVKVHMTFPLIVLWGAFNWGITLRRGSEGALFGVALTLVLFLCVVVHELAHSFTAMYYGVQVREIELSPIGGVAKMDAPPAQPHQEFVMAVAGPLANLLIAVPLGWLVWSMVRDRMIMSTGHFLYLITKPSWQGFVLNLLAANLVLAIFNLLPAFPLDGGRLLRSALAWRVGQRKATRWAARVGQAVAVIMALAGLLLGNLVLALIALIVFVGAHEEARFTEVCSVLGDMRVAQALITPCPSLSPDDTLESVVARTMRGLGMPAAITEGEHLTGWLREVDAVSALATYGPGVRVGDIMQQEFVSVSGADTLIRARQLMASSGQRVLPVADGSQLLGTVSLRQIEQIYRLLAAQQQQNRSQNTRRP